MTRQLFALLAILSGLAVLQAPAHASQSGELSCDVQTLSDMADATGNLACAREHAPRISGFSGPDRKVCGLELRGIDTLPPSFVLKADRALE